MEDAIMQKQLEDAATALIQKEGAELKPVEPKTEEEIPSEAEAILSKQEAKVEPTEVENDGEPEETEQSEEGLKVEKPGEIEAAAAEQEQKSWLDMDEEVSESGESKPKNLPKEVEQKIAEFEKIKKDPFVEAYLSEVNSGGDVISFIKKVAPEKPISIEGLSNAEIHKLNVSKFLSEEELEQEMEHFDTLSPLQKKRVVDQDKAEIEKINSGLYSKLGDITKTMEEKREQNQKLVQDAMKSLDTLTDQLKGVKYRGVELNEDKLTKIKDHVINVNAFRKVDGTYDIKEAIQYAIFKLYGKDLEKAAKKEVVDQTNKQKEQIMNEVTRASKNTVTSTKSRKITDEEMTKRAEEQLKQTFQSPL